MKRTLFITLFWGVCQLISAQAYSLSGTVTNQDGEPIAGAKVSIVDLAYYDKYARDEYDSFEVLGDTVCICTTDADGHYSATFNLFSSHYWDACFMAVALADGYPGCRMNGEWYAAAETDSLDFTLCNMVTFHRGQQATIILPTAPDPTAGQFFRLARVEQVGEDKDEGPLYGAVFELEPVPQANTPYVIIPSRDFQISTTGLDFSGEPGYASIVQSGKGEVRFAGTFQSFILDELSESHDVYSLGDVPNFHGPRRLDACHAYLVQPWHFRLPIFHDGSQAINSIHPDVRSSSAGFHDLQGRRLSSPPAKGICIQNGKKVVR